MTNLGVFRGVLHIENSAQPNLKEERFKQGGGYVLPC